ncbi:unnamed protein product, partial [Mesorhabditis spiculigera]
MLLITTVYNIYYSLVSSITDIAFHMDEYGYFIFSKNLWSLGYWPAQIGGLPTQARNNITRGYMLSTYNITIDDLAYIGGTYKARNPTTGEMQYFYNLMAGPFICTVIQFAFYFIVCYFGMKLFSFAYRKRILSYIGFRSERVSTTAISKEQKASSAAMEIPKITVAKA